MSVGYGEPAMKAELKMNARIISRRKVSTPREIGCYVTSGAVSQASIGSASEKYLRADREHQVEKIGWRATRNTNVAQSDR
jgi:hypothetical protein